MESTVQSPPERDAVTESPGWIVVIAHHPDAARVGQWRAIPAAETLRVGRGRDALGVGALDDDTLSREHAQLSCSAAELTVRDAGSRNGTWVNGARVAESAVLRPGDVVELGALLLQVIRPARAPSPIGVAELRSISGAMAAVVDEIRRVASLSSPVVLAGETGVGKSALATMLHRLSHRATSAVLRCATLAADLAAAELHGVAAAAYPGAVARDGVLGGIDGGTLILDGLDDAPPAIQATLRAFVEDHQLRPVGGAPRALDVRIVATVRATGRLLPELASRLERVVVRVPALRDRLEDVGPLLRARLGKRVPSKRLALAMLRYAWPLNIGELDGVVERALLDTGDPGDTDAPIPLTKAVADHLGVSLGTSSSPDALVVARDGSWLQPPGGDRVSLRRRENLALLLRALTRARTERPGRTLSIDDLFRAGWPNQRIDARAAAGRVYVALTSLRNLGLRDVLVRRDDGYLLDPAATIDFME